MSDPKKSEMDGFIAALNLPIQEYVIDEDGNGRLVITDDSAEMYIVEKRKYEEDGKRPWEE